MLKKLTIKQLLLLAFLLAGLLPAMLVTFLSFYQTRSVLKQDIQNDINALSLTVAYDLERMFQERMLNVQSWSQLSIMQEAGIGDIDKRLSVFLHGLAKSYGSIYKAIYVVDEQHKIIASSQAQQIGQQGLTESKWFDTGFGDQIMAFHKIEQSTMAISQYITDEYGVSNNKLVVEFDWGAIAELLNHAKSTSTAIAIQDGKGHILASTDNWQLIQSGHGMYAKQRLSQIPNLPNWQIHVEKLHSAAVAPVHKLGYIFLALLFITVVLAIFTVRPIAHAITEPITRLTKFVRNVTHRTKETPPQSGPPEVRELGLAFQKMMDDLEQSQADLTRAAKLAVVGEMAAAMSHEVRTPLGILRSSADVLKREKNMSEEGKEVLTFIDAETERMNKLVSTLIDAARPRAPAFSTVNLTQLIAENINLLNRQAKAKNIEIEFNQPDGAIHAEVDADQITQVIMNLVMNAIQVLKPGGHILIVLKQSNTETTIEVQDDGEGIAPEHQAKIFESFFTKRTGGVGLGLAIVKQIIQAHKGNIIYQQSKMSGAQFTITFPNQSPQ